MHDRGDERAGGSRGGPIRALVLAAVLVPALAFVGPPAPAPRSPAARPPSFGRLEVRAAVLADGARRVESFYRAQVEPVERILAVSGADPTLVRTVALALVHEGQAAGVDPRVLASVLMVENPWLDPLAESSQGALGLMQVMPQHAGRWGCASSDLTEVAANICHGARIFAAYLRQKGGDLDRALLAYNGCVRGENTPNCHLYPAHVYSRAGRAAMSRWLQLH